MTELHGELLIDGAHQRGQAGHFRAQAPASRQALAPDFSIATEADVDQACQLAQNSANFWRDSPPALRTQLLETIALRLEQAGEPIVARAQAESALPEARLRGELARTTTQLRLFADLCRSGHAWGVRIDRALPERTPPRSDLRQRRIAVGPVAVFGASNFPLAFSVAGGDTASALAAGCPVVVKAHPAHPGTSELVGREIQAAVAALDLPAGLFALLHDHGTQAGAALVAHPAITAVGFTGSRRGGLALQAIAQQRRIPIPVYAEMSSVNPVFLLPDALQQRAPALAREFVASLTLGVGQFCTNPGLVLGIAGDDWDGFVHHVSVALADCAPATMLTDGICASYDQATARLLHLPGVALSGQASAPAAAGQARALAVRVSARDFLASPTLSEEIFGPAAVLIECRDLEDMAAVAQALEGQLTATLHLQPGDYAAARTLLPLLEQLAGRILVNGFPTGVEVAHAMMHGGPFPATTHPGFSSVGSQAIERFLRPVCYQNFPPELLAPELRDDNPLACWQLRDGVPTPPR